MKPTKGPSTTPTARRAAPALPSRASPTATLRAIFAARGFVRLPDSKRRKREKAAYKKGAEVRLALSAGEVPLVARLLRQVGLVPGATYLKRGNRVIQPVYGLDAVRWFQGEARAPGATSAGRDR